MPLHTNPNHVLTRLLNALSIPSSQIDAERAREIILNAFVHYLRRLKAESPLLTGPADDDAPRRFGEFVDDVAALRQEFERDSVSDSDGSAESLAAHVLSVNVRIWPFAQFAHDLLTRSLGVHPSVRTVVRAARLLEQEFESELDACANATSPDDQVRARRRAAARILWRHAPASSN